MIPLAEPNICGNELKYVKDCLDTGWVSYAGKYIDKLEEAVCRYTGAKHAVALINGTSALHLALMVAGVEPGDKVIVPSLTFVATINAIKHCGAEPIFVDCDDNLNLDMVKVKRLFEEQNIKAKAILPVHVLGNIANMQEINNYAFASDIAIVEDAAQALGSWLHVKEDKKVHAGLIGYSGIGVLSFSFNKITTAGAGGMIITNNKQYAEQAKYLALQAKDDKENYIHDNIGYNYGMSNINAAVALAQIENLNQFLAIKEDIFRVYQEAFKDIKGIKLIEPPKNTESNYWFTGIVVDKEVYGMTAYDLREKLKKHNIESRLLWRPNHKQVPYLRSEIYELEKTIHYHEKTLCLPCGTTLSFEDQQKVIALIKK